MTNTNILNRTIRVFPEDQFRSALCEGEELYNAVMGRSFSHMNSATLAEFFEDACSKRNPLGYVDLYPCGVSDATKDVRLLPTYSVMAIGVWLMNTAPEKMNAEAKVALSELSASAFSKWIMGDGTEVSNVLEFLQHPLHLLASADAKSFIEAYPGLCPEMEAFFSNCIPLIRAGANESSPKGALLRTLAAEWDNNTAQVFVYGTLMSGQPAAHYMEGCTLLGRYCLRDYAMYDLGRYPGIVEQKGETVVGEVYRIPVDRLPEMDAFEGEGSLYHRRTVTVEREGGSVAAQAYIYAHRPNGKLLREPWGSRGDDRVWYAGYGSNLSAERFACYIQSGWCKENNKWYPGCKDRTLWSEKCLRRYPGRMYFGQKSESWKENDIPKGVAFYDPVQPGETHMRLYKISREQLREVQEQEGLSPEWYGRLVTLGVHKDGCPIYTFTSKMRHECNAPSAAYLRLIRSALINECKLDEAEADEYLNTCRTEKVAPRSAGSVANRDRLKS